MSSIYNAVYSAPKGYDLRVPHNVPMGEIRCLRVVEPFSTASTQKDVVTRPFVSKNLPPIPPVIPKLNDCPKYIKVKYDPCSCTYRLVPGDPQTTFAEMTLKRMYKNKGMYYIK